MPTMQSVLAILRRKTLRVARRFDDYNFRVYFLRHTKEDFASIEKSLQDSGALQDDASQHQELLKKKKADLKKMIRMVSMNRMYPGVPVVVDRRAPPLEEESTDGDDSSSSKESTLT